MLYCRIYLMEKLGTYVTLCGVVFIFAILGLIFAIFI